MDGHQGTKLDAYSITRPLLGNGRFCECDRCRAYAHWTRSHRELAALDTGWKKVTADE